MSLSKYFTAEKRDNSFGIARSFIGMCTLLTLLFNSTDLLFKTAVGIDKCPTCIGLNNFSIFCLFSENLQLAKWVSISILFLVVIGYRPLFLGILHYWVTWSLNSTATISEGGDQVATVLTLLFIPISLLENKKWIWVSCKEEFKNAYLSSVYTTTMMVIRIQVCVIYLHAFIGKLYVSEWVSGTVLYYWMYDPILGMNDILKPYLGFFIKNDFFSFILSWSVLILEMLLAFSLFLAKEKRHILLIVGICFHLMIFVIFGLPDFFLAMAGALIIYLYNEKVDSYFTLFFNKFKNEISKLYRNTF
jgi:antimicrobial peptide system SdpB family protein